MRALRVIPERACVLALRVATVITRLRHTQVGHIRAFINASQPGMGGVTYTLATTFPRTFLPVT